MWDPSLNPNPSHAANQLMSNRMYIIQNLVNGCCMTYVLINTCRKSKLTYVYAVAGSFVINNVLGAISFTLQNWVYFCQSNGMCSDSAWANIQTIEEVLFGVQYAAFNIGHWLFAFRYFEVAEMLGRSDQSQQAHLQARKITSKVCTGVSIAIAINYSIMIGSEVSEVQTKISDYYTPVYMVTMIWIPLALLIADCFLLFISLVWICKSLKHSEGVMGNEKLMAVHSTLLAVVILSQGYKYYTDFKGETYGSLVIASAIDTSCNFIVTLLMAIIMNQVNTPQVFINTKMSFESSKELEKYFDTKVQEDESDLNSEGSGSNGSTGHVGFDSDIEIGHRLQSIYVVDPYASALVAMLAKPAKTLVEERRASIGDSQRAEAQFFED